MNIKQASKETGVSTDMIRFYEKKGIIHPQRQENNYRDYSNEELRTIILAKQYSMMGIDLRTISHMFQDNDTHPSSTILKSSITQLKEEMFWTQARLQNTQDFLDALTMLESNVSYQITRKATSYYYPVKDQNIERLTNDLMRHGSVAKSVFRIQKKYQLKEEYPNDTGDLLARIHPNPDLLFETYPSHLCFVTTLQIPVNESVSLPYMKPIYQKIEELDYRISSDIFAYEISKIHLNEEFYDILCVEVPIEKQ